MAENTPEICELVSKTELLRIMECPICQNVPFPPIYQCDRGHHLCKFCKLKIKESEVKKCPLCKSNLSDVRNYALEQMVRASRHICPYRKEGCQIEETGDLIEVHIDNCTYRPFICPRKSKNNCQNISLKISEAIEHFRTIHETKLLTNSTYSCYFEVRVFNTGDRTWPLRLIEVEGVAFLVTISTHKETMFWTVLCIGTEQEAKKYYVKITFQCPNFQLGQDNKIQWTIPIRSIQKNFQQLEKIHVDYKFISCCSFTDFKNIAKMDKDNLKYEFCTKYKIKKIST